MLYFINIIFDHALLKGLCRIIPQLSMESRPQNPEFKINPENFHLWFYVFFLLDLIKKKKKQILYVPSTIFHLNRDGSSWVEPVLS